MPNETRRVLVWRERLLPVSETFILNQLQALSRWEATLAGTRFVTPSLPIGKAIALYGDDGLVSAAKAQVWRRTGCSRKLDRLLGLQRPHVIHAHFGPDATYILPTAERQSIPLIATFHGADATSMWRGPRPSVYRHRLQRLFEQAHTLHAVSDFIANKLLDLGAPANKVSRVYIGIPCGGDVSPNARCQQSVLFVGRLVEKKGLGDLLAAMSLLPAHLRTTAVHVVGDGPLRLQWEKEAADRQVSAIFHGAQPAKFVSSMMRDSTVFCVPSKTAPNGDCEGLGMVFLEAGLHALPTVSYLHGGVPEAVVDGETGLLAPEGDVVALARNLDEMLSNSQRASQLGLAANKRVLNRFNIAIQAGHTEELYDRAFESTLH